MSPSRIYGLIVITTAFLSLGCQGAPGPPGEREAPPTAGTVELRPTDDRGVAVGTLGTRVGVFVFPRGIGRFGTRGGPFVLTRDPTRSI
jgi:hypothetical protein